MISAKAIAQASPFKIQQDIKKWKDSERIFFDLLPSLTQSSDANNILHSDFEFDEIGAFDVKGLKACHKAGYILLELMNVSGKNGWFHKESRCDFIAFQFPEGFYIVDKMTLLNAVKDKLPDWEPPIRKKGHSDYENQLYQYCGRIGRKDVFTYITLEDLKQTPYTFLPTP